MSKICYVTTLSISIKAFFIPQLKYLVRNGFDVCVVCSYDESLQAMLGENIRYIPVDMPRGIDVKGSFKAIKELTKLFKKEKFDLVQYSTPNAALYASIAAKKAKVKIRNYHLMGLRYLGEKGLKREILKLLEKKACKNSTHIECVSSSNLKLAIKEKLFKKEKGIVVWNGSSGGVDLSRFNFEMSQLWREEKRKEYDILQTDFVYGFVGRITKDKGIEELLAAFEVAQKVRDNVKLVLIGSVDINHGLSEESMKLIEQGGNVIRIQQRTDIEKFYPMIDVLVLPSYREGFGNVVIEAQSMGIPVIVSDIPGPIDAIINEKTGIKVPVKDVTELAKAMQLAWSFSEKGFAENAVKFVAMSFDSNKLCEKILQRKNYLLKKN